MGAQNYISTVGGAQNISIIGGGGRGAQNMSTVGRGGGGDTKLY